MKDEPKPHQNKDNKTGSILLWMALTLLTIYAIDWGILKGEITKYGIYPCKDCTAGKWTQNEKKYRPSVSRQEVISWTPGMTGVDKYTKCAVVNRKNWQCK